MGEATEKLSGKLGIDTTDFKTGLSAANRELRVLESGFRASAASLGDWTKDATGLEMRIKSLTDQIDIQKLKVAALRENYEKMKAENGENSRAAQDAEIKLNKETETLNKMEGELRNSEDALKDMGNAEDDAGDKAEDASGKVNNFKSIVGGIGSIVKGAITIVAGLAVAVAGVGTAIGALVFDTANASAELVDMSAKTGITTTRLQELAYVSDQVGTSQETITGSLARLTRSMATAMDQNDKFAASQGKQTQAINEAQAAYDKAVKTYGTGSDQAQKALEKLNDEQTKFSELTTGDVADAFNMLGVSVLDSTGQMRKQEDVFNDAITALGGINNEAMRDSIAMSIFGKSAMELNPLIKAGKDELARLSEEAHTVGAVMSEEDVAAFEAFDDSRASLEAGLKGTLGTLAGAFLPGFQGMFGVLGGYLKDFRAIVDGSGGDIGKIATGVGGLLTTIISDVAAQAPQLMQTGITILKSIITAIITNLPMLISSGVEILLMLVNTLVENLPMIIEAGLQAVIALALGLAAALPQLIPAIVQALITIVNTLVQNIPMLIDAALKLILGLAQGLIIALPILIAALPQIITAILNALIDALPMIFEAAGELIGMLATGIVAAIPVLVVALGELIARLGDTLARYMQTAPEWGKRFVQGLGQGIKNAAGFLYDSVVNLINGMIGKIKELLNMHSPSGVGMDIGDNLVGSVGLGGQRGAPKAGAMLAGVARKLADSLKVNIGSGIGGTQLTMAGAGISIGDIYVDARGAKDPKAVGEAAGEGVLKKIRSLGGA